MPWTGVSEAMHTLGGGGGGSYAQRSYTLSPLDPLWGGILAGGSQSRGPLPISEGSSGRNSEL